MPFGETVHYQLDGPGSNDDWDALVPGGGIVYLGDNYEPHSVSMFHQLSCLQTIRAELVRTKETGLPPNKLARHCLNYLRQMALCRSDLALEFTVGYPHVEVFPDTYVCRDWRKVYGELAKNQDAYGEWASKKVCIFPSSLSTLD